MVYLKVVELKFVEDDGSINYLRQTMIDNKLLKDKVFTEGDEKKRVTLLSKEIRNLIDEEELEGLCLFRFYENITIDDFDSNQVTLGQRFKIGDCILEVTSIGKRCFKECKLIQSGEKCNLFTNIVFTKIIKSGYIKIDDRVTSIA